MRLSELRLSLASGADLSCRLRDLCDVQEVASVTAEPDHASDCLVVDDRWARSRDLPQLEAFLRAWSDAAVPRLFWIRGGLDASILRLGDCFERAFTVDAEHLRSLREAGFGEPSVLHDATRFRIDPRVSAPPSGPRRSDVVWIGSHGDGCSPAVQEQITGILAGADEHGLRVFDRAQTDYAEILGSAKVVVAADPRCSQSAVPGVLFDAIVCGAAVVSSHQRGVVSAGFWSLLPGKGAATDMVPIVTDRATAAAEIGRLLSDRDLREETVRRCRRLVLNNHTYAHRLATLASAIGRRIVPDAAPLPAPA